MTETPHTRPLRCVCGKQLAHVTTGRGQPRRLLLDWTGVVRVEAEDGRLVLFCRRCGAQRRWPGDG